MKFPKPSKRDAKRQKALARWERTASIRSALIDRAGGRCEACGEPGVDLHHLLGGGGTRRKLEALDTVVLLCRYCHRCVHDGAGGPVWHGLMAGPAWGEVNAYARDAILRRMERITAGR